MLGKDWPQNSRKLIFMHILNTNQAKISFDFLIHVIQQMHFFFACHVLFLKFSYIQQEE